MEIMDVQTQTKTDKVSRIFTRLIFPFFPLYRFMLLIVEKETLCGFDKLLKFK